MKYENGYIDLNKIKKEWHREYLSQVETFIIDNKKYYYKSSKARKVYNELIAEELAHDYGISNAHYDIAHHNGRLGPLSLNVHQETDKVYTIEDILKEAFKLNFIEDKNTLEDIWTALEHKYKNKEIVEQLMNEIVDVFIFDILIANSDRNTGNLTIIENENGIHVGPLFDNENMLDIDSIMHGQYLLGIDETDMDFGNFDYNFLEQFLNISTDEYLDYFIEKYKIIREENILDVFKRVEARIDYPMNPDVCKLIVDGFSKNRKMIDKILEKKITKEKSL